MTYSVSVSGITSSYSVVVESNQFRVTQETAAMAGSLSELSDVDTSGIQDSYVLMYDATTQKYKGVNPDTVLSKATTEPISPGLPADFEAQLDVDLDNKIDLDAGGF